LCAHASTLARERMAPKNRFIAHQSNRRRATVTKESTNNRRARQSAVPLEERQPLDGRRTTEPAGDEGWDLDPVAVSAEYASMVSRQLALLGEDPAREGLLKTPTRVANAMAWLTRGYGECVEDVVGDALFEEEHSTV